MSRSIAESYPNAIANGYVSGCENPPMLNKQKKTFWERLVEALQDQGYTEGFQVQAAKLAKIKQPSVHKWTRGGYPSLDTGILLAEKLSVCVEWLYTGRGPKRPGENLPPDLRELEGFWDKLPPDVRGEVIGFAKFKRSTTFTGDPERREVFQGSISTPVEKPKNPQ